MQIHDLASKTILRKALNEKLAANKKFQKAIGVNSKEAFAQKMADPLNKGIEKFDLMSIIEFDNAQMEIRKPKPSDLDYHPSFAFTILSPIKGIYQPTKFYKSYDVTDSYTKYNLQGTKVSRKEGVGRDKFKSENDTLEEAQENKINQKQEECNSWWTNYKIDLQETIKNKIT